MRIFRYRPPGKTIALLTGLLSLAFLFQKAQTSFPLNGVADPRQGCYAFTNATIVKDGQATLSRSHPHHPGWPDRRGRRRSSACRRMPSLSTASGKYIYPSFIDLFSDYGIAGPERERTRGAGFDFRAPAQLNSNTRGAYNWNQAIHPRRMLPGSSLWTTQRPKPLRENGFGTVLTHMKDGIARGSAPWSPWPTRRRIW